MPKIVMKLAVCAAALFVLPTSATAFEVDLEQMLCPIETVGEAEVDTWGDVLQKTNGELQDTHIDKLTNAVATCVTTHGWNEDDTKSVVEFNIAIIGATAMERKLSAKSVDAVSYESVLDDQSAEALIQILMDSENSPVLRKLTERMIADLGDSLTDEIAGDLGAYIAFMAQAQYSTMKMMDLAD